MITMMTTLNQTIIEKSADNNVNIMVSLQTTSLFIKPTQKKKIPFAPEGNFILHFHVKIF